MKTIVLASEMVVWTMVFAVFQLPELVDNAATRSSTLAIFRTRAPTLTSIRTSATDCDISSNLELRCNKELIQYFISRVNIDTQVDSDWRTFILE